MQFVQMFAGHPHVCIKAVRLAEIHQLQVRLKRGVIAEQLGCLNSDVEDEADFCTLFKRQPGTCLLFYPPGETFAKNNQLPLGLRFKQFLVGN